MQKVIDQITDHLVTLVTNDKDVYNPKELLKSGIPSFVVERIRLLLEDKVKDEISAVVPVWFKGDARLVIEALEDYTRSAVSNSHIPKEHLYEIINSVVKDIIYVFVEPRKNMAEYIFRDNDELSFQELEERCAHLTIYKHFGAAIPLYMKKRELESLSKDRCKVLIHKLDAKLVASYTANDWAQKLEQLFVLFGGKVDPLLLATFFEDKGLYGMAGKFEHLKVSLTKTDFIEIISSEDSAAFSPDLKPKEHNKKERKLGSEEVKKISAKDQAEQNLVEDFFGNYEEEPKDEIATLAGQFAEGSLTDDEMSELLSDIAGDGVVEVDNYDHVDSLNKLFSLNSENDEESQVSETSEEIAAKLKEKKEEDTEDIAEFRENLVSILDQAKHSYENIDRKEALEDIVVDEEDPQEDTDHEESIFIEEENDLEEVEGEEKPIWAKFINEDQMDVIMGGKRNKPKETPEINAEPEDEIEVDDNYSENPFIDDDANEDILTDDIILKNVLEDRKLEFIDVIFSGSEKNYDKALTKMDSFKTWKETSKFIQKEIFLKNDVDMFSGATVDFTDRIHQYFNEQQNS
tara:strand:- start:30736 stop:32463 length:1728 start_codon:yes stop_codon:yes gene_type:complete